MSYEDFVRAFKAEAEPAELERLARKARADLHQAIDAYNEALDPLRDDDGLLPREHEGHEAAIQETARYLVDLEKSAPLDQGR